MKLSPSELAEATRQAAAVPQERNLTVRGLPGGRDQPLSCAALLAERRALLGLQHG